MADDQVKYSDLIVDDGAIDALDKRLDGIKRKMAEVKGEAATLTAETRNLSTATREQQQATAAHAAAAENLRQKMKGLTDEQKQLEAERRKYAKLTEQEANRVKAMAGVYQQYADAVRQGTDAQMKALPSVDMQNKSYNELYQTYNALKDALNRMTVAERENTVAGKSMVNQAKEIRDTLNNLQQATGNYALNVGNYMSAMNGLQFQAQQLMREIPSAINLQQFFLAISNNIPMFAEALARYNKGLPEIKAKLASVTAEIAKQNAQLATMNVESAEYAAKQAQINDLKRQEIQLQGASVSGWKAIIKSVGSWQTLLIAVLLILRNLPSIIEKIKGVFVGVEGEIKKAKEAARTLRVEVEHDLTNGLDEFASKAKTELSVIIDQLSSITQGSEEWVERVQRINEITGETIDLHNDDIVAIKKITNAYIDQIKKIEKAKRLMNILSDNDINKDRYGEIGLKEFYSSSLYPSTGGWNIGKDAQYVATVLGLKGAEVNNFIEAYNELQEEIKTYVGRLQEYEKRSKELKSKGLNDTTISNRRFLQQNIKYYQGQLQALMDTYNPRLDKDYESKLQGELDELYEDYLGSLQNGNGKGNQKIKDQVDDLLTLKRQLEDQIIANIENEYKRLDEEETKRHERFIQDQEAELAKLAENDPRRAVINQMIEEENRTHERKMEEIDEKRYQNLQALTQKRLADEKKAAEEEEKQEKDNAKNRLKEAVDGWAEYKAKMVEEGKTRKQIVEAEVAAEIARLNLMLQLNRDVNGEIMSDEQKAKVQEWINLLEKLQQTGNYGDYKPGQFMGKGGANVTNERKNYANIWEVLGIDMDNNQVSALNSVFDQAKEALNSWMDARKAAADQAKELADDEVSAAENALNREIELRNQGYANNVALRERELADAKKRQQKALEMQQKAKEEELAINTAMEASSMAVAIANLFKQFPLYVAIPLTGVLLGAAAYAKYQAFSQIRSTKYREGGVMLLEGGSHESGHDVNLGIGPDGSNLRAEGGEYFAVINKRNSRKYGSEIPAVVNALNSGMFEDRYIKTSDAVGMMGNVGLMGNVGEAVDLSAVESGVGELVRQGESKWTVEGEYRVERYKNRVRRVKIG